MHQRTPRYNEITETPGVGASCEQFAMLATRYELAAREAGRGRILEVACGAGIGLGFLAHAAREVVGCDIDPTNVGIAAATYRGEERVRVELGDAMALPYASGSFEAIVCFEAIYYFPDLRRFLTACQRILTPGGKLVLCSVNASWSGFNPSPFSTRYWTPRALADELWQAGYDCRMWSAFPNQASGLAAKAVRAIRKAAVQLHVIPRTMRGKVLLKRLIFGQVLPMPSRLEPGMVQTAQLQPLDPASERFPFKVYYVLATPKTHGPIVSPSQDASEDR